MFVMLYNSRCLIFDLRILLKQICNISSFRVNNPISNFQKESYKTFTQIHSSCMDKNYLI